jgi:CRP-like cAMP-binding protein
VPILQDHGWLAQTPSDFRQAVLERLSMRKVAAGERLYSAGDREGGLWGIIDGGVKFEIPGPQFEPGVAHMAIPGFWFGETSLIRRTAREVDVYAAQSSVLAMLSLADCRTILCEDPARWQWIALLAGMNHDLAMGLVADLLLQGPQQRLVATLLRLSGWRAGPHLSANPVSVHLSQQQLGLIANLSRTVVSSILLDLKQRGLIDVGYRTLEVLDGDALEAMLGDE